MYELSTQYMTTPAMVSHDVGHRFVQKSTRLRRTAACGLGSANVAPCNGFSRIVQDLSQEVISYEDVVHSPLEDISRLSATSNQACNNSNIDTCNAVLNILRKNRSLKRAQSSMKSSLTNLVCGDERRLADTTISRQMNLHSRQNRSICGMPTNCFIQNIDDKETLVQIGDKSTSREGHSDRSNMHHMYGYTADEKQDISKSVFSSLRNSSKVCSRCGTSKTPLWRSGPLGPKSLCNACGIRLKKTGRSTAKLDLEETSLLHEPSPRMLSKASISDEYDRHTNKKSRLSISIGETEKRFESEGDDSITETLHQDITREHVHCETQLSHRKASLGRIFVRKNSANETRMAHTATRDEEEGAILLMALSCGYINARS